MANDDMHELPISSEAEIVAVRKTIRQEATRLGFNITDITRVVTAASELARNVYRYAKTGVMRWKVLDTGVNKGLEIIFEDHGPGIPNVDKAMEMGYSTGEGLGLGLPGTKRLADEMEIESAVGKGTKVTIRKWLRKF